MSEYTHCGRSNPCPVCGGSRRCSIYKTGDFGFCREPSCWVGIEPKIDSTGQAAWKWDWSYLAAGGGAKPLIEEIPRAEPWILDQIYQEWLRQGCSEPHRRAICERYGVSWEDRHRVPWGDYSSISRLDARRILDQTALRFPTNNYCIPGHIKNDNGLMELVPTRWKCDGILIACRNHEGQITALKARLDRPLPSGDRYLMVSSAAYGGPGPESSIHFPDNPQITDTEIWITEGEFKGNIATFWLDRLCLSLPGASNWSELMPVLQDMAHVQHIVLAFDMDVFRKPLVARGLYELAQEIRDYAENYRLSIATWDPRYKGLDDLLVMQGDYVLHEGEKEVGELLSQIAHTAGLELENERMYDIIQRIQETKDPRILTEPGIMRFYSGLSPHVAFTFDTEVRSLLGKAFQEVKFRRAIADIKRGDGGYVDVEDPAQGVPVIETRNRPTRWISERAVEAVYRRNDPPRIFYYGDTVARIAQPTHGSNYEIQVLETKMLKAELERCARWQGTGGTQSMTVECPFNVAQDLLAYPEVWNGLPRVEGMVAYPVFDAAGQLVAAPGYNARSRLLFNAVDPLDLPPLPEYVSDRQIEWARSLLDHVLTDFQFKDSASRAYAFSFFLLPPVRYLIDGLLPLYGFDGPTPGTGKTTLYDVLTAAWIPGQISGINAPSTNEEWDKRILSALQQSSTHILFDNVRELINSAALALVLTRREYQGRILGLSRLAVVPNNALWAVTGNNLRASEEIERRMVRIRLEVDVEDPSLRQQFTLPDIVNWVKAHRRLLMTAGLWLVKAWLDRGKPRYGRQLASYESWSWTMGGILSVAGVEGFLEGLEEAHRTDASSACQEFVLRWWKFHVAAEVAAKDLLFLTEGLDLGIIRGRDGDEAGNEILLARRLAQLTDTVHSGLRIRFSRFAGGRRVYFLEVVNAALVETNAAKVKLDFS